MKLYWLSLISLLIISVFCSCAAGQKGEKQLPSSRPTEREKESQPLSVAEFSKLYRSSTSESERRAVSLLAIDKGAIYQGGSISSIDEIFGTNFNRKLPTKKELKRAGVIHFVIGDTVEGLENSPVARAYGGWHLVVEYNYQGKILTYYLTNLNKGMSTIVDTKEHFSIAELERLYKSSSTAEERRRLCLQAIDSSIIVTTGPIASIDRIFATHFASSLPSKRQVERTVLLPFGSESPMSSNSKATSSVGDVDKWFLAVQYDYNGDIQNYYLSNVQKMKSAN